MTELFQSGQAVLAVWGTGRVQSFANTGFPVDFVYPKEGAATLLTTACPITKPNASPLASSFVKMLLDPKIQLVLLKDYGYGPVLKSIVIPPEFGKMAPIGERAANETPIYPSPRYFSPFPHGTIRYRSPGNI